MGTVFISHSFKDQNEFKNLTYAFQREKIDIWNPSDLQAGKSLEGQLRKAIDYCSVCVFLATERSINSPWCLAEVGAFWGAGKRVIIFIGDHDLKESSLPPQFAANLWTRTLPDAIHAVKAALSENRKSDGSEYRMSRVEGLRLFQHKGFYPIDLAPKTHEPSLNREKYIRAIDYLLEDKNDRLAAMDLVYIRVDNINHRPDILPDSHVNRFINLVEKYSLNSFIEYFEQEKNRVFRNYLRLVRDFGKTLKNVYFEILLHDVRNPIRSIIAAQNSEKISGRRLFDPSTRFVYQYVTNQARDLISAMEGGSKVAYFKKFSENKMVKATTTPIFDDRYGLVGILCINIDIEAIEDLSENGKTQFFEDYIWNTGVTPEFERQQFGPK